MSETWLHEGGIPSNRWSLRNGEVLILSELIVNHWEEIYFGQR